MNTPPDLKDLERKAWNAYFQDGWWDIYCGLLLFCLGLLNPGLGGVDNTWLRLLLYFVLLGGAWLVCWAGRRYLTMPRLGWAKFSAERHRKKAHLRLIMGSFVLFNILLIFLTLAAARAPQTFGHLMPGGLAMDLFIGIFAGSVIAIIAYFSDFHRGYYIALVYGLTFALVEIWDSPAMFWLGGLLVFIPGVVLLARFLQQHPLPPNESLHGQSRP